MLKLTTIRLMVCAGLLEGQPVLHGPRMEGLVDASGATSTRPVRVGPAAPIPPCSGGETYFSIGDAAGQNLYLCQHANVWNQQVSAPYAFRDGLVNSSGAVDWAPDPSIFTLKNNAVGAGLGHSARDAGLRPGTGAEFSSRWSEWIVQVDNASGVRAISASDVGACFGFVHAMGGCVKRSAPALGIQAMADSTMVTCVDTGVEANTATWYRFKLSSTTPGTIDLSINGSSAGSISANVHGAAYSPSMGVAPRSAGGVAKLAWLDYFSFRGRRATI